MMINMWALQNIKAWILVVHRTGVYWEWRIPQFQLLPQEREPYMFSRFEYQSIAIKMTAVKESAKIRSHFIVSEVHSPVPSHVREGDSTSRWLNPSTANILTSSLNRTHGTKAIQMQCNGKSYLPFTKWHRACKMYWSYTFSRRQLANCSHFAAEKIHQHEQMEI